MTTDLQVVDRIERAGETRPFCECGRHTTAVWRDGVVWLECAALAEPPNGLVDRLIAAVSRPRHLRQAIVDVPAA